MTVNKNDYTLGGDFAEERTRLAGIESLWDPGSQALLDHVGLRVGWSCLEAGAGGGSLVEWMAARRAYVTAVDIDTRFLRHLQSDLIDVRRIDVRHDELPRAQFDLVHARMLLEHLDDRCEVLARLAATLRPGGWMLIEDYDWETFRFEGDDDDGFAHVADVCMDFMARSGYDKNYGRRLVRDMADAGLRDVSGEGRMRIIDSGSQGLDFFRLSLDSLRAAVLAAGLISQAEAQAASTRFDRYVRLSTPLMMAGIGRR
ncbi:methyltransferase domain-containing protein [Mycobacterium sp. pW049]|uniref:class I SAM-dependent methyltransferase n=1 Tax=[Mycobacterium] bulgaricum TaxID=3238985 RepID=UPI00351B7720